MSDTAGAGELAGWIQAGGVVAFAGAVLFQLRELKPLFVSIGSILTEVQKTMSALLERERARAERLAAQDAARMGRLGVAQPFVDEEVTQPIAVEAKPRARTEPGVYSLRPPRGGDG